MERVGQRVTVYWPDEGDWFGGQVQDYDDVDGFFVVYDDGDERWEADASLIRFPEPAARDDDEAADQSTGKEAKGDEQIDREDGDAPRQMLEPPESPTGAYDDDYEDADEGGGHNFEAMAVPIAHAQDDAEDDSDGDYEPQVEITQPTAQAVLSDDETNSEEDESSRQPFQVYQLGDLGDIDDELEQSIDVPETCASHQHDRLHARASSSTDRFIPERGRLFGQVLRGVELPPVDSRPPSTFVKVSFAEAGDSSGPASLMLRCKQTLASTAIAPQSTAPAWTEDEDEDEDEQDWSEGVSGSGSGSSAHFQLDLTPPTSSTGPLWDRVLGDLVFAVYAVEPGAPSVFLGQAVVSLQDLLRGFLTKAPSATRSLGLTSRSGKPLPPSPSSVGPPELVVSFHFAPSFANEVKLASNTIKSSHSRRSDAKPTTKPTTKLQQHKASAKAWASQRQPSAPSKSASSGINRRRFERQVAKENVEQAKRLEWQAARRGKLRDDAKAQEKSRVTPPQHGARKLGHKASSGINRCKFSAQVSVENRVLGRRLQAIGGGGKASAKASVASPSLGIGGRELDKAYAADKRQERRMELDFRMQQAQAKYNRQHELVAEVTGLQDEVARLKQQTSELLRGCSRLDALHRRDCHTRDCLSLAAAKERSAARGVSKPSTTTSTQRTSNKRGVEQSGAGDGGMRQRECELLEQERDRLEADKQQQRHKLAAVEQELSSLTATARGFEASLRAALAQRAFRDAMRGGKSPMVAQAKTEQMQRRVRAKDVTSDELEQWTLFQAHEELAQLQLAVQVLEQRVSSPSVECSTRPPRDSSPAATVYLTDKVERATIKLKTQQEQAAGWQRECEAIVKAGKYEELRSQVQELQQLVFLCRAQGQHERRGERQADRTQQQMDAVFTRRVQAEQTETEAVLNKPRGP